MIGHSREEEKGTHPLVTKKNKRKCSVTGPVLDVLDVFLFVKQSLVLRDTYNELAMVVEVTVYVLHTVITDWLMHLFTMLKKMTARYSHSV